MDQPEQPKNCDPVAWAEWNHRTAQIMAGQFMPEAEMQLAEYEIEVREMPLAFAGLETAIHRAVSELENQGEKSNRIATQLLTALALFHAEMEQQ